jgi:hypothetical protein
LERLEGNADYAFSNADDILSKEDKEINAANEKAKSSIHHTTDSALELFIDAVDKERKGNLSDALVKYRLAFKV